MVSVRTAPALLDRLTARASRGGVLTDFDGVLSPIVDDPEAARPLPGVPEALEGLRQRYQLVGVLSGRSLEFLERVLPAGLVLSGLYGLEVLSNGGRRDHPYAGAWREAIDDVAKCSASIGPEGMVVEQKGLSLTLHYRAHPELADEVHSWAEGQAGRSGLVVRPARKSIELHPPIDSDKGTALDSITRELEAVCYIGDDVGDLPAFDALDRLAAAGTHTLKVAVASDEGPSDLLERADLVVDGPEGVLSLLREL